MEETADGDRLVTLAVRERVQLSPDSVLVFHARYVNPEKTRLRAIVRLADGRLTELEADCADVRSPLLRDVRAQMTEAEIELMTERQRRLLDCRAALDRQLSEDRRITAEREETARAKASALAIPEIKELADASLRHRIRRAKSVLEVSAWTAVALQAALRGGTEVREEHDGVPH